MNKKDQTKIIFLSVVNVLLGCVLIFLIYIALIRDANFKKMGYSYSDIHLIKKYQLEDKISEYNQSFVYALNSADFDIKKIDYYLLFNSPIDYTKVINDLADLYSIDEMVSLSTLLSQEQLIELVDHEKVTSISSFKALLDKRYDFDQAVLLVNHLDDGALNELLKLPVLNQPENFIRYIQTGYKPQTAVAIYQISEDAFNLLSNLRYFEQLDDLVQVEGFKVSNLARYFWHMENYGSSVERAVARVNINAEYVSQYDLNYLDFYQSNPTIINEVSLATLVNKSHVLSSDYTPDNLVEVDPEYRGNNQLLVEEVALAFVEMAKACEESVNRRILAYSNYRSYAVEQTRYSSMLIDTESSEETIAGYASKPGYSEHQTGLAIDIAQKNYSYTELEECVSYDWLDENCYLYGFIRRYPGSKAWITGYQGNAYHYRYVGKEIAKIIHDQGWVLEEYAYLFCGE